MLNRRGVGKPCAYCERPMEDRNSRSGLAVTRDHHVPRSKGGRKIVLACRVCNSIKGDMMPRDWEDFMRCFPRWWENPKFNKWGLDTPREYATAWDKNGEPYRFNAPRSAPPRRASKTETKRAFAEWNARAMRERKQDAKGVPYEESMMILRHGKDYWKAWKDRGGEMCDCCRVKVPKSVPIEYDDPKAQAAFEGAYKGRLYMLRLRG